MKKSRFVSILILACLCAGSLTACFPAKPPVVSEQPPAAVPEQVGGTAPADAPTQALATQVALPVTAAPPVVLPLKDIAGVHLHVPLRPNDVALTAASGAHWTRAEFFLWDKIEPVKTDPPTYDWSVVDEVNLRQIAENGMQLTAVILFTPGWAQQVPGVDCGPIAAAELPRFAMFVRALVERYSQPPYNIKYWEVGNEPDIDYHLVSPRSGFGCWGDIDDPVGYGGSVYTGMLREVYPQVKQADPDAKLLVGGLLMDCDPVRPPVNSAGEVKDCTPSLYLDGILKSGGGDYFDGVSFHAYDFYSNALGQYGNQNWNSAWNTTGPAFIAKARYIRSLLVAAGYTDKELYLTELAVICGRDGTEDYCLTDDLQQTKALYLVKSILLGQAENLDAVVWFGLYGWRASGIVKGGEPLPVYQAIRFYQNTIAGAPLLRQLREYAGVQGFVFEKEGREIWVVWSADGVAHQIELPGKPAALYNVVGDELEPTQSLEVTVEIAYLIW